jgi:hypothetical protein
MRRLRRHLLAILWALSVVLAVLVGATIGLDELQRWDYRETRVSLSATIIARLSMQQTVGLWSECRQ